MLEKTYSPGEAEATLYPFWEQHSLFRPEVHPDALQRFSMVIPPPNVTGALHMGHALDNTLQDILARWHRMKGDAALWMPGTDHAGIATQNVVERNLREQGVSKFDLGRTVFLEKVWEWAEARKIDIVNQFKRLGISPDWSRQRFTLDEGLSKAVREAFVTLYDRGLIYRGTYIVNWCPRCTSAISDIETEYQEEDSYLWEISYPLKEGPGALIVATTRPETMFGDVAVAVNPNDSRYKGLIGKTVILPLANIELPIIGDEYVDMAFGTGALKITPAHDPNDYEIALRHGLEPVWVIDENGALKSIPRVPESIQGLDRVEARKQTEALLQEHQFLIKKTPHAHSVGHCQRCSTTIEPLLSKQWFVRCKPLAQKAIESHERGEIQFIPERWTKVYLDWMHNIRDWCISRQLWWGHQIPAWYCQNCNEINVATVTPEKCQHCASVELVQETDVLDTWFSSGLWPFSTMGWPDINAPDFKRFYPTDVLVTGFDIIFFWVARMTMFGLELTGKSPFETVYIHGLIRDEKGQKMSKSKGNTIDPVEIINEYGCDALRYSLTSLVTGGQDIKLSKDSFDQARLFANKLWNASRFVLMNLEGMPNQPIDHAKLSTMDQWILNQLNDAVQSANQNLEAFQFGELARNLYRFIWNDFCDWYVEYAKKELRDEQTKANTQVILCHVLDQILKLVHPIMPYITETLWQQLPTRQGLSIMISQYPMPQATANPEQRVILAENIQTLMALVRTIREVRQSSGVPLPHRTPVIVECPDPALRQVIESNEDILHHFLKLESLSLVDHVEHPPANSASGVVGSMKVFVSLAGAIDLDAEIGRQKKKLEGLLADQLKLSQMLNNPNFVERAPAAVVEKNRAELDSLNQQIQAIEEQLSQLAH